MKRMIFFVLAVSVLASSQSFAIEQTTLKGLGAGKNVKAELFLPDGKGPFPAVLVLHTSAGVKDADISYARQLALEGFASLVPYYFDAYGISYNTRAEAAREYAQKILADFESEIAFLKTDPGIKAEKIGAVGFSMGGYWALLLAARGEVQAGVSYYGAFSGGGKPRDLKYPLGDVFTKNSSPVLLLHGTDDSTIPVEKARRMAEILKENGIPYEIKIYEGAGHDFERRTTSGVMKSLFKSDTFDPQAAEDGWKRTLEFLNKYLKK